MKLRTTVIAGLLFAAGPALAQTPAASTPPTLAPHSTPGQAAPAKPAAQAPPAAEKIDPAKDAAIRHLLDVTDTSKMSENIAKFFTERVHSELGRALPAEQLPKFMDTFTQKFQASYSPAAVNDAIVSVYAKHFSTEEIQALTKFYESPIGQRVVKEMPDVDQQMRVAGQQIEGNAAIATLRSMSDEYPQLKQMLPPDGSAPASSSAPAPATPGTPAPATKAPSSPPPSTLKPAAPER
ncbi:MAG TPA: DUF2059 domain-containing protein [Candidatus Acidoferrales bacterium]